MNICDIISFGKATAFGRLTYLLNKFKYGDSLDSPNELIYVQPNRIDKLIVPSFTSSRSVLNSYILNGEWDRNITEKTCVNPRWFENENAHEHTVIKFENFEYYTSVREYILNDKEWNETRFYEKYQKTAKNCSNWSNSKISEKLELKKSKIDLIYKNIKENGYLSQKELQNRGYIDKRPLLPPEYHEIRVNIGRDGEIIFDDGRHRMFLAKILNVDKIPARVVARHTDWQKTKYDIMRIKNRGGFNHQIKANIQHPDIKT